MVMGHAVRFAVLVAICCLIVAAAMLVRGDDFALVRRIAGAGVGVFGLAVVLQWTFRPADPRLLELAKREARILAMTEALEAKAKADGLMKEAFTPTMTVRTTEPNVGGAFMPPQPLVDELNKRAKAQQELHNAVSSIGYDKERGQFVKAVPPEQQCPMMPTKPFPCSPDVARMAEELSVAASVLPKAEGASNG